MKPSSQIAILKTVVQWQAQEIAALQMRVEHLEKGDAFAADIVRRLAASGALAEYGTAVAEKLGPALAELYGQVPRTLTGSIQGNNGTVTMTIPPEWEDGDIEAV